MAPDARPKRLFSTWHSACTKTPSWAFERERPTIDISWCRISPWQTWSKRGTRLTAEWPRLEGDYGLENSQYTYIYISIEFNWYPQIVELFSNDSPVLHWDPLLRSFCPVACLDPTSSPHHQATDAARAVADFPETQDHRKSKEKSKTNTWNLKRQIDDNWMITENWYHPVIIKLSSSFTDNWLLIGW